MNKILEKRIKIIEASKNLLETFDVVSNTSQRKQDHGNGKFTVYFEFQKSSENTELKILSVLSSIWHLKDYLLFVADSSGIDKKILKQLLMKVSIYLFCLI